MAKRNLARTAIEGGRAGHCRDAEHEYDQHERHTWRDYCAKAVVDPEVDEPYDNAPQSWDIGRQGREFDDRLNPVLRWLESQIGRPWNKVHSEIAEKFDGRTLAGRHVLGHVRGFVTRPHDVLVISWRYSSTNRAFRSGELYIDAKGFLRQEPRRARR